MGTFITADYHLGESRMALLGRPFRDAEECFNAMLERHNAVVAPSDVVIVLGDVCYQKALHWLPMVAKFNGRKVLVRGNHDRGLSDSDLAPYFSEVREDGDGFDIDAGGVKCFATHYPTRGTVNAFNLVGHVHAAWKYQLNMLNVGVDVHHFRPVNLDTVMFHREAICKYYDEDVWVAYSPINAGFRGARGKPGSYFSPAKTGEGGRA